jgi:hypothetical protein
MVGSGFPVALHPRVMGSFLATVMLIGSSTIRGNDPTEMTAAADVESDLTGKQNKTKYKLQKYKLLFYTETKEKDALLILLFRNCFF